MGGVARDSGMGDGPRPLSRFGPTGSRKVST